MANMTYLNRMQEFLDLNSTLSSLFDRKEIKAGLENLRQHYNKVYGEDYFKTPISLECKVEPSPHRFFNEDLPGDFHFVTSFQFKLKTTGQNIALVIFELSTYPHCCGMRQMNGFSYSCPEVSLLPYMEEIVHEFVQACVNGYMKIFAISSRRVMINFVERNRRNEYRLAAQDVIPVDNPAIDFPYFHSWAKKQAKYRTSLMFNQNSGNILHHAEVCL